MPRNERYISKLNRRKALENTRKKRWDESSNSPSTVCNTEEPSPPVTRPESAVEGLDANFIVNLKKLAEGLKQCTFCSKGNLHLDSTTQPPIRIGLGVIVSVKCQACGNENMIQVYVSHRTGTRGPKAVNLNTISTLAMVHTGQGYTHLNAEMSLLGLGSVSRATFKKREREVGQAIEGVCMESCNKWREKEGKAATVVDDDGDSLVGVSYDGAWQKRGKARDSSTGFGTVIGQKSGKVLDYGVKCRVCAAASDKDKIPPHDCRRNFDGSSKSMEPEIAVECFNAAPNHNLKYSEYVGDEDTTAESHIKYRVNYSTEKRTDKNHATRTLGSRLYEAQRSVRGLSTVVINYIKKLFAYCISQNQGNQDNIQAGLQSLAAHAFGEHKHCGKNWCGALKDPTNFKYKDLPGGKALQEDNLRAAIESAIKPFQTPEWHAKLTNCGSSQANESVNGVVSTKAPKNRHYGGSESLSFRVSAGISQFNEGARYLSETSENLGIAQHIATRQFVDTTDRKRKRERERKATRKAKRRRKDLKKEKARRKNKLESKEGKTYETGVGVTQEGQMLTKGMIASIINTIPQKNVKVPDSASEKPSTNSTTKYSIFAFDFETTSLKRDSEILQIACVSLEDHSNRFSAYMVPDEGISPSASKVTDLTISFQDGKKILMKGRNPVDTPLSSKDVNVMT